MRPILAAILSSVALAVGGCTSDRAWRSQHKAGMEMFACMYKAESSEGLTCREVFDLQAGCYAIYRMKVPSDLLEKQQSCCPCVVKAPSVQEQGRINMSARDVEEIPKVLNGRVRP